MATDRVSIFEVGPRDGLQNEKRLVPLADKVELIQGLVAAGLRDLEVGAFVRTDRVPQMADSEEVLLRVLQSRQVSAQAARYWTLVPNRRGLERALRVGVTHFAVFTAATESFARRNIGMSISESLEEFRSVIEDARSVLGNRMHVRGYVSTAFGCPFEGKVTPAKVMRVVEKVSRLGVDQISIGDTIGVATPKQVVAVMGPAVKALGKKRVAGHFHDTRGTALVNALGALEVGVRTLDSSAGGLGGCPFAPGASGNLATEDLVYFLHGMGIKTGIDLDRLCKTSLRLAQKMKRPLSSRYLQAFSHGS